MQGCSHCKLAPDAISMTSSGCWKSKKTANPKKLLISHQLTSHFGRNKEGEAKRWDCPCVEDDGNFWHWNITCSVSSWFHFLMVGLLFFSNFWWSQPQGEKYQSNHPCFALLLYWDYRWLFGQGKKHFLFVYFLPGNSGVSHSTLSGELARCYYKGLKCCAIHYENILLSSSFFKK